MTKTKLGIGTGLLAALAYFTAAFGGYTATLLVCGYVLLFERNGKLRKSALTALLLMVLFTAATTVMTLFGGSTISFSSMNSHMDMSLTTIYTAVVFVLNIIPKIILSVLGVLSLTQKEKTTENQTETIQQDNM